MIFLYFKIIFISVEIHVKDLIKKNRADQIIPGLVNVLLETLKSNEIPVCGFNLRISVKQIRK